VKRNVRRMLARTADELPVGLYLVDRNGTFEYCNPVGRAIFCLPPDARDLSAFSIRSFYEPQSARLSLLKRMREQGGQLRAELIALSVNGVQRFVLDSCCFTDETEEACLGVVADVTDLATYYNMLQDLPVGVYSLSPDKRFVRANRALAEILGYRSPKELLGRDVAAFYSDPRDLAELETKIAREENAEGVVALRKADGKEILAKVWTKSFQSGVAGGRFGALIDVTQAQRYMSALEDSPTGYYTVALRSGRHMITSCNKVFALMFGYALPADMADRVDITQLYARPEDHARFLERLAAEQERGGALRGERLLAKKKGGERFWIAIDCKIVRVLADGTIAERMGTVRDIDVEVRLDTEVRKLREDLEATTRDVDRFLHNYLMPILRVESSLAVSEKVLEVTAGIPGASDEIDTATDGDELESSMKGAMAATDSGDARSKYFREELERLRITLSRRANHAGSPLADILVAGIAAEVLRVVRDTEMGERSGQVASLVNVAGRIAKRFVRHSIEGALGELEAIKSHTEAYRARLGQNLGKEPVPYDFGESDVVAIVRASIEAFSAMALDERGRRIEYTGPRAVTAEVAAGHLRRMLDNMLLNAIKYSHKGRRGRDDVIGVKIVTTDHEVLISATNYGVPIKREEIESGVIFQFGRRGEFSHERDRMGSGIGMYDIREIASAHGGTVKVTSTPVAESAAAEDYSSPFLTTVAISLPRHHSAGGERNGTRPMGGGPS